MRAIAAVAIGGMLGTALRLGLDLLLPHDSTAFPLSTLIVNVTGAFVLGLLVARLWPRLSEWMRAALGAGVLGSFTTFSAIAVSTVTLGALGSWWLSAANLVLSLVLGLAAAALGVRLGQRGAAPAVDWVDE